MSFRRFESLISLCFVSGLLLIASVIFSKDAQAEPVSIVPGYVSNSAYISSTFPTTLVPGQSVTGSMTFYNNGNTIWLSNQTDWLGQPKVLLRSVSATNWGVSEVWGSTDYLFGGTYYPGNYATFRYTITAPTTPGTYCFQWKLYNSAGYFFGDTALPTCGLVVAPPTPAPTVALTVNPPSITSGQSATLAWSATNATSLSITTLGLVALNSSTSVSPNSTTTYTATATGPGGSATASAILYVAPEVDIKANDSDGPLSVPYGGSATLTWTSRNTAACTGSGSWSPNRPLDLSGTAPVTGITDALQFTITCTGPGGSATDSVTMTVLPPPSPSPPTMSNLPSCSNTNYTGQGTISWSGFPRSYGFYVDISTDPNFVTHYTKQVASGLTTTTANFVGPYPATSQTFVLTPQTTYYIRVYNGQHGPTTSFRVPDCVPTVDLKAGEVGQSASDGPLTIDFNHSLILRWSSSNAATCTGSGGSASWPGGKALENLSGEASGNLTRATVFSLTCANPFGRTSSDSVAVIINLGPLSNVSVVGDVFSSGNVSGLSIDPSSVVIAGGSVNVTGSTLQIPAYRQSSTTSWDVARQSLITNLDRLHRERGQSWTSGAARLPITDSASRVFNSNSRTNNPFIDLVDNQGQPEGGVWVVNGDLEIVTPFTFKNRGTIIVTGNIRVTGNGSLAVTLPATLGLAALGSGGITFEPTVTGVSGVAFFAANGPIVMK